MPTTTRRGPEMSHDERGRIADITFVGFLLGHGGDALQMLDLANGMMQRGVHVKIVLPLVPSSETFKQRCDDLGIECERTPLISASMKGSRQSMRSIIRLLRSIPSPVVHFHSGDCYLPRTVMASLELLRYRRAFVTLQSPYETMAPRSARARFWAATARRRLQAVVSPSVHACNFQRRCGLPDDLTVTVRNSIDVSAFGCGDAAGPRSVLGVDTDDPVVLFCSRIDRQKRPVEAVRIFGDVAAEFPTATLAFVGQGDEEAAVAAEAARLGIRDRVRLVGYQTNVADWLAAATVWLLPTERENFSVAVLEALAAGCPVLSTRCPGNDEVLVDGVNSVTFPVGDVVAGAARLRALLGDPRLRASLGANARASAQEYTVDKMVDGYQAVYQRAANLPAVLRRDASSGD